MSSRLDDHERIKVVTKVSDPPKLAAEDIARIEHEANQLHEAFTARTASMEILTVDERAILALYGYRAAMAAGV